MSFFFLAHPVVVCNRDVRIVIVVYNLNVKVVVVVYHAHVNCEGLA